MTQSGSNHSCVSVSTCYCSNNVVFPNRRESSRLREDEDISISYSFFPFIIMTYSKYGSPHNRVSDRGSFR